MPASHLDSLTVISAPDASGGAPPRSKASPPPDPQAVQFRKLFARVFGEQVRQEPAVDSFGGIDKIAPAFAEEPATLRSLQIGQSMQIITAGPPMAEEDLLRFAREAGLDEASIAALLAAQAVQPTSLGEATPPSDLLTGGTPFVLGHPNMPPPPPLRPASHTATPGDLTQGASSMAATGPAGMVSVASTRALASLVPTAGVAAALAQNPSPAASAAHAAFGVSVAALDAPSGPPLSTSTWVQSRGGEHILPEATAPKSFTTLAPETAEGGELSADTPRKDGFTEKGLTLRLDFQNLSIKDRLKRLLGPEALKAMQASQPHGVRLESLVLFDQSAADPFTGVEGPSSTSNQGASALTGAALGASTGSGSGSGGQGTGSEGGRPDANAQAGQGRGLPQQVMQRFGELLGQRLLQQVSQGNWRVELDLEPGDLGSIRIELELRKGEIEASIKASQASTRELLQESLPRLRETLERNGMDVASLSVGQQDRRQSDGQSSSGRNGSGQRALAEDSSAEAVAGPSQPSKPDDGRLDVWA